MLGLFLCSTACSVNRREALESSINTYVKALSRNDDTTILSYAHKDKTEAFYKNAEKLSDIHISSAETKTIFPDESLKSALVTVMLEYISSSTGSVVQSRRFYNWKYDEKTKGWYIDEATPFGRSQN